ncbi:MAG: hypothetical protein CEE40_06070 [Chloroflexi bacterium B3_Chlor]|nr:MAG: hypothetical protein CEE40_06070 [Chloroflexi bacterium B3_Chlor]
MKLKYLFIAQFIIGLVNGVGALVMPAVFASLYGFAGALSPGGLVFAQVAGAAFLGHAITAWFARNAEDSVARRAIVLGFGMHGAVGGLVVILALLSGVMGPMGWVAVLLYLGLALAYGYCAWKPESV